MNSTPAPWLPESQGYRLYGVSVASRLILPAIASPCPPSTELSIEPWEPSPPGASPPHPLYQSERRTTEGQSLIQLFRLEGAPLLQIAGGGEFLLEPGRIRCRAFDGAGVGELAENLVHSALVLWLELAGVVVLHASAVVIGGRALVFLGPSTAGKSTLAAFLLGTGASLLSDDIVPLRVGPEGSSVAESLPQLRLLEETASHLLARGETLSSLELDEDKLLIPLTREGRGLHFELGPVPLGGFYLLSRGGSARPRLELLSSRDSVRELLRHSFAPRLVEGLGLAESRLERLVQACRSVPLKRLLYPDDLARLPEVGEVLRADLGRAKG